MREIVSLFMVTNATHEWDVGKQVLSETHVFVTLCAVEVSHIVSLMFRAAITECGIAV